MRTTRTTMSWGLALSLLAMAPVAMSGQTGQESARDSDGIPGLRQVREGLLTAAQPRSGDWQRLRGQGVTTVVNLRPDGELEGRDEADEVRRAGLHYHQVPVAGADDLTDDNARTLWSLITGSDGPVLVHCGSANRAGALLAIAAARHGGLSPQEALALGRGAGLTQPALEQAVRERLGIDGDPP